VRRFWKDEVQHRVGGEKHAGMIFSFGTNDCTLESGRRRVSRGETLGNARALLADAMARFPVVVVGPPETLDDDKVAELAATNTDLKSTCEKLKLPYLDLLDLGKTMVNKRKESRGLDGWHPNAAWYAEAAVLIESWPALRAMLDKMR
jgi:lysophospholipase L1-like esterase